MLLECGGGRILLLLLLLLAKMNIDILLAKDAELRQKNASEIRHMLWTGRLSVLFVLFSVGLSFYATWKHIFIPWVRDKRFPTQHFTVRTMVFL